MSTSTVRSRVAAALLSTAALAGLTAGVTVAAAPAQAAVSHVEFNLRTLASGQLTTLVLTARLPQNGSRLGFGVDNDSSSAQWAFIREPDNFTGRYVLRATENTSNPLCMDGTPNTVTLSPCNGSPAQLWTYSSSLGLKSAGSGLFTFLPAGNVLDEDTNLLVSTQSTRMQRLFVP
ncbi:RICIN domain-containing protein [Nonomuraea zeae]|uniref:Ricin B lectin domain-containing protein n=1 Tax=Nonomuraea zeae TaxID=1642303 RepID=A0A5S4F560_9ACTN|nr:hypothetical protein [Nonomuraea zeae]TMR11242.1 hypothetical protein ETD85_59585 [Nonomuraea zeae]